MKRFYITLSQLKEGRLDGEEFNHLKNVMRTKVGDLFLGFCGGDFDYECEVLSLKKDYATFKVNKEIKNTQNPNLKIDIFQALAKGEKMELVAQKTTEIGLSTFFPLL